MGLHIYILYLAWSVILILGCLYWLVSAYYTYRLIAGVQVLEDIHPREPEKFPKVSLIVPACNEGRTIEAAMESRLNEDYPNLEIILMDDRSTDGTGDVVDRIARKYPQVKAIHITELPDGWLGKIWAMQKGLELATGDWLLFTDADVFFKKGTIRKAVSICEQDGIDHLGLLPELQSSNFLLDLPISCFIRILCLQLKLWEVKNPKSKAFMGVGAFNLVRRSVFDKTPGLEWLKLEPGDDVALGLMMKNAGARPCLMNARREVRVAWYTSLRQMAHATERAPFTAYADYTLGKILLISAIIAILELSPFLALLSIGIPWLQVLGLITSAVAVAVCAIINRWAGRPVLPSILVPAGSIILIYLLVRSGFLAYRKGGFDWRGTFYPTGVLRKGRRIYLG